MTQDQGAALAALRADAENPLIPPSRRVAARKALRALAETERDREALVEAMTWLRCGSETADP